jgi:hypothetical protein
MHAAGNSASLAHTPSLEASKTINCLPGSARHHSQRALGGTDDTLLLGLGFGSHS